MKGAKKFFSYDSANKGLHVVIKIVLFQCIDRVITLSLDSDAVVGDNINTAEAADKSLRKTGPLSGNRDLIKEVACGLSTDSGGGSTKEGLVKEMSTLGQ